MEHKKYFLSETSEIKKIEENIREMVFMDRETPEQVFKQPYEFYLFNHWDWMMSKEGWESLQYLLKSSNEEAIIAAVLKPHPFEYHFKKYKHSNWARIPVYFTSEQYEDIVNYGPDEDGIESICQYSRSVIWVSSSSDWIIYGDWEWEICILACRSSQLADSMKLKDWITVEDRLLNDWLSMVTINNQASERIWTEFQHNYKGNI